MNKLEELHLPHSQFWDCYNDEPLEENHALKSAEITIDVAVKFAVWVNSHSEFYKELDSYEKLFKEFINNHYGK